jgi:hypothetical protein
MAKHGSASVRKEILHANNHLTTQSVKTKSVTESGEPVPNAALSRSTRRRALRIINNSAIDPSTRGFIRYALGINDPWTPSLVRRAEAGEIFGEGFSLRGSGEREVLQLDQKLDQRLEALTGLICRVGNEPDIKSGALLLLMSTIENSSRPKSLATTTKYLAFMRCCELNVGGMVDAQLALIERQLLS